MTEAPFSPLGGVMPLALEDLSFSDSVKLLALSSSFCWKVWAVGIDPSFTLFLAYFHLGKGRGSYNLIVTSRFSRPSKKTKVLVSKAPSSAVPTFPAVATPCKETPIPTVPEKEAAPRGEGSPSSTDAHLFYQGLLCPPLAKEIYTTQS
ncbi:hypothetical protein B296_00004127 [Ensete ventricosum]|uniref:Uncharacterized protein n=1 Tax=Ensete ventricosum TaxID=4639 RepID=A0A427BBS8_ENSVE|nr:hypothetical protein B296_00004127 [Ensete ventricosum]